MTGQHWQDKVDKVREEMCANGVAVLVVTALDEVACEFLYYQWYNYINVSIKGFLTCVDPMLNLIRFSLAMSSLHYMMSGII